MSELSRPLSTFVQIPNELIQRVIDSMVDLGTRGVIRVNDKQQFSVFDIIEKIAGKEGQRKVWERVTERYPEVVTNCHYFQFPGQGQRETPVADMATTIEIIWLLPGEFSDKMRRVGAEIVSTIVQQKDESNIPSASELLNAVRTLTNVAAIQSKQISELMGVASDHIQVRRYSDKHLPGLNELTDKILDMGATLPSVTVYFTAPEWIKKHAPEFTDRQRRRFYDEMSSMHKLMVQEPPIRIGMTYQYSNKYEYLCQQTLVFVRENVTPHKPGYEPKAPRQPLSVENTEPLTEDESALIGKRMLMTKLFQTLGFPLPTKQNDFSIFVQKYINAGVIKTNLNRDRKRIYYVNAELIQLVKNFNNKQQGN
jgi:hypothetical protein